VIALKVYYGVFAALLVLTLTTTGVAYVDLGGVWNVAVALTIAFIKALLVALFFMHLRYSSRLTWLFAGAGIFWLATLLDLTLSDYFTRGWIK
jgi:cytochrome c oxidase subunit 4